MSRIFFPGIYRHFKGGRYVALAVAEETTNLSKTKDDAGAREPPAQLVVYRSLNTQNNGAWFAREQSEFLSHVGEDQSNTPGLPCLRFALELPFEPTNYREPDEPAPSNQP